MIKGMINELNSAMYDGTITFDVVKNLCNQLSKLTGREYSILNRRVVVKYPDGRCEDAWANA